MGRRDEIGLRQWIAAAVGAVDTSAAPLAAFGADPQTLALSSDAFLLPAVRIALSLAEEVRNAREVGGEHSNGGAPRRVPKLGSDWAGCVAVRLSSSERTGEGDLQPLPFSPEQGPVARPSALQDMLSSVIGDASLLEEEEDPDDLAKEAHQAQYLSVTSANFVSPSNDDDVGNDQVKDEAELIYSLGSVFYELFSGGERLGSDGTLHPSAADPGEPDQSRAVNMRRLDLADDATNGDIDVQLSGSQNGKHQSDHSPEQSLKKKSATGVDKTASVEVLKTKGVPQAIVHLVTNMLDSIHGDISGDESYQRVSDICDDLQLMLDRPRTYLDDLDLAKLSVTGLPLSEIFFGREAEFATLREAYTRSISGDSELAIVSGPSGVGKSVLAQRLGHLVAVQGGMFLSGKFDQQQAPSPFSAIAVAFNQYCDALVNEGNTPRANRVASELRRVLGREAHILCRVIPRLSNLIGQDCLFGMDQGCVNAHRRLLYLMCEFVEAISSCSDAPIVLFLDDIQWADSASIEVVQQLLLLSGSMNEGKQFFFLGCIRDEEAKGNQPLLDMLANVTQFGVQKTAIDLTCLGREQVNALLSDVLCLFPRLTRPLAEMIHSKTRGNPLFFSRLLMALFGEGLLRLSLSRQRWEWDEERIMHQQLPDDVADFLARTIGKLPQEVQTSLSLLSCFGASTDISIINALEAQLGMSLLPSLEKAVSEGVLNRIDNSYNFAHDKLQEACYNTMAPEDICMFHLQYGIALVASLLESSDHGMAFAAANQLNRAGPKAVDDVQQAVLIANLNLTVGKKAMAMSDYQSAYDYFDHGISFLPRGHWQEQYSLSLELHVNGAKCALFIDNVISLKILSDKVMDKARSYQDQLEVLYLTVSALAKVDPPTAIAKAIAVLSTLGEEFSDEYTVSETRFLIEQTKTMLDQYTEDGLLNYKSVDGDLSKTMAMKFLSKLELLTQTTKPSWQPVVTVKMVAASIKHGYTSFTPLAFVYFGVLLASPEIGNIREGYKYAKLATKLLQQDGYEEVAGETIAIATQVKCFVEPVQSANEFFLEAYAAAMSAGDMNIAILSKLFHAIGLYWGSEKLGVVRDNFVRTHTLMQRQNHMMWLSTFTPIERTALTLVGVPESELPPLCGLKGSSFVPMLTYFNQMYTSFMFRDHEQMLANAEKFFEYGDRNKWILVNSLAGQACIGGLTAWSIFRETKDHKWVERASKAKIAMKKWADACEWNFVSKYYLMSAEEAFSMSEIDSAKDLYEKAISSAKKHRFVCEEALANELAGYFFVKIGEKDVAVDHFLAAHEKYHDWGATAKANALYEFVMASMAPNAAPQAL